MTVYTVFANTNDHEVRSSNATYATARSGGTLSDNTSSDQWDGAQYLTAGVYYCFEYFVSFDTSAIPAGVPAMIQLRQTVGTLVGAPTQTINFAEQAWSGGTADWIAGASLPAPQYAISVPNNTAAGTTLASTSAPSNIPRSTAYKLVGYSALLRSGSAPAGSTLARLRTADYAGTSNDPTLVVGISVPYTLAMEAGAFSLAGQAANLRHGRVNKADVGTFEMTGRDALLNSVRAFAVGTGTFLADFQPTGLRWDAIVKAAVGAFVLLGKVAMLGIKRLPPLSRTISFPDAKAENRTLEI